MRKNLTMAALMVLDGMFWGLFLVSLWALGTAFLELPNEHRAVILAALTLGLLGGLALTACGWLVLHAVQCGRAWLRS